MFFQKILYDRSFNDLQQRLLDEIQQPRQLNLQRRFSIHEFHAGIQQVSHITFLYIRLYALRHKNFTKCIFTLVL